MKKFLTLWLVLLSAVLFYSCGNPILDIVKDVVGGSDPGGEEKEPPNTTAEDVPKGVTPIYIDTDKQLEDLLAGPSGEYPAYGYYILRGNGVEDRTFTVTRAGYSHVFTGTFTGWYKDDTTGNQLTKVKSNYGESLFAEMDGATVSWLKFETGTVVSTPGPTTGLPDPTARYAGVVAARAEDTAFENVSVSGTVNIDTGNLTLPGTVTDVYVGGIVGKADEGTIFEYCTAGANVTITISAGTSVANVYAGGITGILNGSVKNSSVESKSSSGYSSQVAILVDGKGGEICRAGGIAGLLDVNGKIESSPVNVNVTAKGLTGDTYAGGYFGEVVTGGGVAVHGLSGNNQKVPLNVTFTVTATTASPGNAYAGGVAGKTNSALKNNRLSGSNINITASTTGKAYAGGIAGHSTAEISDSSFYNGYGSVMAGFTVSYSSSPTGSAKEAYAGGIAGYAENTAISKSYASVASPGYGYGSDPQAGIDARVNASNGIAAAGGIAGKAGDEIFQSYAVATIKARATNVSGSLSTPYGAIAGGIAGIGGASIANTFALAQVDARVEPNTNKIPVYAGGIVGYLEDAFSVQKSYAAGSVLAHTFVAGGTVYAGGIAGYAAATSGKVVEKCVALQRSIGSDGTMFRVIGGNAGGSDLNDNYAYEGMKKYGEGSIIIDTTNNAGDKTGGADISKSDATNSSTTVFYTTTLGWSAAEWDFSSSNSYPKLNGLDSPSVPSWATLP